MTWQALLDHLITVEGECLEENYGEGSALNSADEECNAGIRQAYADLLQIRSVLLIAPELLEALRDAEKTLRWAAQRATHRVSAEVVEGWLYHADKAHDVIAKADQVLA